MNHDFREFKRTQIQKRLKASRREYCESLRLTERLYRQALEAKKDVLGNEFSDDELNIMSKYINSIGEEIAVAEQTLEDH